MAVRVLTAGRVQAAQSLSQHNCRSEHHVHKTNSTSVSLTSVAGGLLQVYGAPTSQI